jgi:phenylpropionate dioxygenase-like ring-hydroxylating dioxygenase large terminal subunit
MNSNVLDSTFPNSWFRVATSNELPAKKVIPLRYFGKDFVLFRAENGTPYLLDAHCPHMGAHLGYTGTVRDETIRCPYHGWLWNGKGSCVDVPYTNKQPKVQIKSYPVREVNGLIFIYYHEEGNSPDWEIPELPELNSNQWTFLRSVKRWKARTNLKNYLDNSIDVAHLSQLHSQTFKIAKTESLEVNGPVLTHKMSQKYNLSSLAGGKIIPEDGSVTTTYYGPGYDVSFYWWTKGIIELGLLQIFTGTPIDQDYLDIQIFISVKRSLPPPLNLILEAIAKKDTAMTFDQDIPILENKIYLIHPPLYEEDGPIMQARRWASQFYKVQAGTDRILSPVIERNNNR